MSGARMVGTSVLLAIAFWFLVLTASVWWPLEVAI